MVRNIAHTWTSQLPLPPTTKITLQPSIFLVLKSLSISAPRTNVASVYCHAFQKGGSLVNFKELVHLLIQEKITVKGPNNQLKDPRR